MNDHHVSRWRGLDDLDIVVASGGLDGGFVATCPALPGVAAQGETEEDAVAACAAVIEEVQAHLRCWGSDAAVSAPQ